jgi:hypothetical protein
MAGTLIQVGLRLGRACAVALLAWGVLAAGARRWCGVPGGLAGGLIVLLGMHLALDWEQRASGRATTYAYGRDLRVMREAMAQIRAVDRQRPHRYWISPLDMLVGSDAQVRPGPRLWDDPGPMALALEDPRTAGLVIAPSSNSLLTFRRVLADGAVRSLLAAQYAATRIGEYTLWIRKPADPA